MLVVMSQLCFIQIQYKYFSQMNSFLLRNSATAKRNLLRQVKCEHSAIGLCWNQNRFYCSPKDNKLPIFMCGPEIIWPSMLHVIRNWFLIQFYIKQNYDREFNIREFAKNSGKAVTVVSELIYQNKIDQLSGLLENDALTEVRQTLSDLNDSQRESLYFKSEDIFFAFPYKIDLQTNANRKLLNILMVYHVLKNHESFKDKSMETLNIEELRKNFLVLNVGFLGECQTNSTLTNAIQWSIDFVNFFRANK